MALPNAPPDAVRTEAPAPTPPAPPLPPPTPPVCYDDVVRDLVKQENQYLNYRTTWLATLNGLLFAALGFAWDKTGSRPLIAVFVATGIGVSLLSLVGFVAASSALYDLNRWWQEHLPAGYQGPPVVGLAPRTRFANPWNLLPILFLFCWLAIGWVNWLR